MFLYLSVILFKGGCLPWIQGECTLPRQTHLPLGTHPPQADTHKHTHTPGQIPPDGHAADATHPTGMYSCSVKIIFIASQELLDLYSVRHPMYMLIFEKHFANFNVKQVRMIQKLKDIHLSIIMLEDHFCS